MSSDFKSSTSLSSAKAPTPPSSSSGEASQARTPDLPFTGAKRLRQIVTIVATGSLGIVLLIALCQLVLKPGLRPSDIAATLEAQTEIGIFNQRLGAKPGEMLLTEDQYRAKIAQAERSGQAKAEIAYQRDLAAVQADKERVVGAYQTLYQRTNMIAEAGVRMESMALQFRQRLVEQTNGGRAMVISVSDGLCALGIPEACESARRAREGMIEESERLTERKLSQKVAELMAGIPDPASLVAHADSTRNGTPTVQH